MNFKGASGILIDLDGTLTDYNAGSEAGLRAALKVLNETRARPLDWETFQDAYNAVIEAEASWSSTQGFKMPARENRMRRFRILFDGLGVPPGSLLPEMADAYGLGRSTGTHLYPEVHGVLTSLKKNYKLGILSEGSSQTQLAQIEAHHLTEYFAAIVISDQTPWHKPDESLYRYAALRMELEPEKIVMVGDRLDWDIKPSKEIGMKTIYIKRSDMNQKEPEIGADAVINNLQDLLVLL